MYEIYRTPAARCHYSSTPFFYIGLRDPATRDPSPKR